MYLTFGGDRWFLEINTQDPSTSRSCVCVDITDKDVGIGLGPITAYLPRFSWIVGGVKFLKAVRRVIYGATHHRHHHHHS